MQGWQPLTVHANPKLLFDFLQVYPPYQKADGMKCGADCQVCIEKTVGKYNKQGFFVFLLVPISCMAPTSLDRKRRVKGADVHLSSAPKCLISVW